MTEQYEIEKSDHDDICDICFNRITKDEKFVNLYKQNEYWHIEICKDCLSMINTELKK